MTHEISGTYAYDRSSGEFDGPIRLNSETQGFSGNILDRISVCPQQTVSGLYVPEQQRIIFVKRPSNLNLRAVLYDVRSTADTFAGEYAGKYYVSTGLTMAPPVSGSEIVEIADFFSAQLDYPELSDLARVTVRANK